jgi:hypothetical protein
MLGGRGGGRGVNFLPAGKVDKPMNIAKLRADLVTGQYKHLSTGTQHLG